MKDETHAWLMYAIENLKSANVLYSSHLYSPCLQNLQQAVEKSLKAIIVEKSLRFSKTHNILELKQILEKENIRIDLTDDECDFLNVIYLPSKYPLSGVLPDYHPSKDICLSGLEIAEKVVKLAKEILNAPD
jgi:HEPN domain-containing protein